MTVQSSSRKAGPFLGNGVATAFPFTFKVFTTADITVVLIDGAGTGTTLALDTDYTVSLNADQDNNPGGTITYPVAGTALPLGRSLVVLGALQTQQGTDLTNLGRFLPQSFENALDYLTMLIQQLEEISERTLRLVPGEEALELPPASERAMKLLGFDENGQPIATHEVAGTTSAETTVVATEGQTVFDFSPLTNVPGSMTLVVDADGIELAVGDDYEETSATTITLSAPVPAGMVLKFRNGGVPISMGVVAGAVRYMPTGATPRVDSIQSVLRKVVKRPQDNGDVLGDATTAVQNAITALEASGSELLTLDIGDMALRIDGEITCTQPIQIEGQGVYDIENARGITRPPRGSWFIHNGSGPLFRINQNTSKGASIARVGIFQAGHPAPGPGWAPAAKDWVIRNENTQGTLHLDRVHFHNVYDGILCDEAHRPQFRGITGQFFHRGVSFDRIYDEGMVDGFRGWTYWSEHDAVLGWSQANGFLVTMGRVDGMRFPGRLFGFGLAGVLYCGASAATGGARVITIGDVYADFCQRGVIVDNPVTHLSIDSLFHLGQKWPASPALALTGGYALDVVSGTNSLIRIGHLYGNLTPGASVRVLGNANQVWIDSGLVEQYDKAAGGAGPFEVASGNQVYVGNQMHAINAVGAATPVVTGAAAGVVKLPLMQQFIGGSAFNRVVSAANATGQLAVLTAEGDTDAGIALLAKLAGVVNIAAATNQLAHFGGAGATKQTVAGSWGGNAAGKALAQALAAYSLITDNTTL